MLLKDKCPENHPKSTTASIRADSSHGSAQSLAKAEMEKSYARLTDKRMNARWTAPAENIRKLIPLDVAEGRKNDKRFSALQCGQKKHLIQFS